MSAKDAEVFRKAAEVLEQDGWVQGKMHTPDGHCLIGALEMALWGRAFDWTIDVEQRGDMSRLAALFGTFLDRSSVIKWNDAEGRTKEDVVKALLQVADTADVVDMTDGQA